MTRRRRAARDRVRRLSDEAWGTWGFDDYRDPHWVSVFPGNGDAKGN